LNTLIEFDFLLNRKKFNEGLRLPVEAFINLHLNANANGNDFPMNINLIKEVQIEKRKE